MTQLVLELIGSGNGVGNLFAQKLAIAHPESMKCLFHRVLSHPQLVCDFSLRGMPGFTNEQDL